MFWNGSKFVDQVVGVSCVKLDLTYLSIMFEAYFVCSVAQMLKIYYSNNGQ